MEGALAFPSWWDLTLLTQQLLPLRLRLRLQRCCWCCCCSQGHQQVGPDLQRHLQMARRQQLSHPLQQQRHALMLLLLLLLLPQQKTFVV